MKNFTDNKGREWSIEINVASLKRVRSLLSVDLLSAVDGKLLEELVSDPVKLVDVIFVLVKPKADVLKITDEDFGAAMAGDAIDAATEAFLSELVDFFPLARRRLLAAALIKLKALENRALELAEKRLNSPELEKKLEAAFENFGETSMNSPGSSASTQAASPSGN